MHDVSPLSTKTALGLAVLCSIVSASGAHADQAMLAVGDTAPDVSGTDAKGNVVRLAAQKGRYAIVYFYPKDDTPGCTKEACAFRDAFDKFVAANVVIFGVSRDDEASHQAFRKKHALPFPLVADPSGTVQRAYRVPENRPGANTAKRVSFLVGPDGKIARVWPDVDPGVHAKQVLGEIEALRRTKPSSGESSASR